MPYLQGDSEGLELFRVTEVVDVLPVLKTSTVMPEQFKEVADLNSSSDGRKKVKAGLDPVDEAATVQPTLGGIFQNAVDRDATSPSSSRPPTPPGYEATTPAVNTGPCPSRLTPLVPPVNYGTVERKRIFRSGFLYEHNVQFMESLGVRSILALVDTLPTDGYRQYMQRCGIKRIQVSILPNKNGNISTSLESICEALLVALNPTNYPLHIHCNHGRHRTGCVVACLRKLQGWPLQEILAEYDAYAAPKARSGDVDLIKTFDPDTFYHYARSKGLLHDWSRCTRIPVSQHTNTPPLTAVLPMPKTSQPNVAVAVDEACQLVSPVPQPCAAQPTTTSVPAPSDGGGAEDHSCAVVDQDVEFARRREDDESRETGDVGDANAEPLETAMRLAAAVERSCAMSPPPPAGRKAVTAS